ncbi:MULTISPECIES: hypothetical protein [Sorangium]|uniref:hypothetical protein n=1 Tax=Sorangium TaxID=39643 RepID=UPI003D9C3F29
MRAPATWWAFPRLDALLAEGPLRQKSDGTTRRHRDFYRGLAFLAELEAVYRGGAPPPYWATQCEHLDLRGLRQDLRLHYPVELVTELHDLLVVARRNLPRYKDLIYNPVFGGKFGGVQVGADGDLLLDDLLLELKTKNDSVPELRSILQLLGYAALDAMRGNNRVRRVGIYNSRWGLLWTEELETVSRILGWSSSAEFRALLEKTMAGC